MIKNHLKVAWRNLVRNKAHTFINMAGLSVGLACSLLILLWVQNELDMDASHKNGPNLYQVYEQQHYDNKINGQYATPGVLAAEIKRVFPEVQYAVSATFYDQHTFKVGDKIIKLAGGSADADFFKMFTFPLLQGNAQNTLRTISDIAISKKMAEEFFGSSQSAIGKTIRLDDHKNFIVTSVFENVGANSSLKFDYLINWFSFLEDNPWAKQWGNNTPYTYIQLRRDANPELIDQRSNIFWRTLIKMKKRELLRKNSACNGLTRYTFIAILKKAKLMAVASNMYTYSAL